MIGYQYALRLEEELDYSVSEGREPELYLIRYLEPDGWDLITAGVLYLNSLSIELERWRGTDCFTEITDAYWILKIIRDLLLVGKQEDTSLKFTRARALLRGIRKLGAAEEIILAGRHTRLRQTSHGRLTPYLSDTLRKLLLVQYKYLELQEGRDPTLSFQEF